MQESSGGAALPIHNTKWGYTQTLLVLLQSHSHIVDGSPHTAKFYQGFHSLPLWDFPVNYTGDMSFQPKAIAEKADQIHKHFN